MGVSVNAYAVRFGLRAGHGRLGLWLAGCGLGFVFCDLWVLRAVLAVAACGALWALARGVTRPQAYRIDEFGVTLGAAGFSFAGQPRFTPWSEIAQVVVWTERDALTGPHRIGVKRWDGKRLGVGDHTRWIDFDAVKDAVASFAPDVPVVNEGYPAQIAPGAFRARGVRIDRAGVRLGPWWSPTWATWDTLGAIVIARVGDDHSEVSLWTKRGIRLRAGMTGVRTRSIVRGVYPGELVIAFRSMNGPPVILAPPRGDQVFRLRCLSLSGISRGFAYLAPVVFAIVIGKILTGHMSGDSLVAQGIVFGVFLLLWGVLGSRPVVAEIGEWGIATRRGLVPWSEISSAGAGLWLTIKLYDDSPIPWNEEDPPVVSARRKRDVAVALRRYAPRSVDIS